MTPLTVTIKTDDEVTYKRSFLIYHNNKYFPSDFEVEKSIKETLELVKDSEVESVKYRARGEC